MTARQLQKTFEAWCADGQALVLATVYETEGSTYSKAGAQMLINAEGDFQGMLSGGCLEGDLAERARAVLNSGEPQAVTYDLGKDDEELWGLGVGCDGLMRIFLQALTAERDYEPFASMCMAFEGHSIEVAATVLESPSPKLPAGATLVTIDGELAYADIADAFRTPLQAMAARALLSRQSSTQAFTTEDGDALVLCATLTPAPRFLVLGAGLDTEPVVRFASELGWRITVQDHRPAYIESGDFSTANEVHCMPVSEVSHTLDLNQFDAVIVMSHHLASDREYLRQLADCSIAYVGLLGPLDRRRRLLDELGDAGASLQCRLHGPAGIDIGGRGPAVIALSIIAEVQQGLSQEHGN